MSDSPCRTCTHPSRRAVLAGAGALGVAGLLSACGGGEADAPMAESGPDDPVVVGLDELREKGAVGFKTADGDALAIARGDDVVAYSSRCTHEGCTVAWDADAEQIACPCHGSLFDPADGSVLQGPAREPLPAVPVTVDDAEGVLRRG